jgi:hypothetical protein
MGDILLLSKIGFIVSASPPLSHGSCSSGFIPKSILVDRKFPIATEGSSLLLSITLYTSLIRLMIAFKFQY